MSPMAEARDCACEECRCSEVLHPNDPPVCKACRDGNHEGEPE